MSVLLCVHAPEKRTSANPGGVLRALVAAFPKAISQAADRLDQLARRSKLTAQRLDMHVNGPLQHQRSLADGGLHQLRPGKSPPRLAKQTFQQPELGRREVQVLRVNVRPVSKTIDAD